MDKNKIAGWGGGGVAAALIILNLATGQVPGGFFGAFFGYLIGFALTRLILVFVPAKKD